MHSLDDYQMQMFCRILKYHVFNVLFLQKKISMNFIILFLNYRPPPPPLPHFKCKALWYLLKGKIIIYSLTAFILVTVTLCIP